MEDTLAEQKENPTIRFVGFVEGVEKKDTTGFLNHFLATALVVNPPVGGFEVERAHLIRMRHPNERPRTIITAFVGQQDC